MFALEGWTNLNAAVGGADTAGAYEPHTLWHPSILRSGAQSSSAIACDKFVACKPQDGLKLWLACGSTGRSSIP